MQVFVCCDRIWQLNDSHFGISAFRWMSEFARVDNRNRQTRWIIEAFRSHNRRSNPANRQLIFQSDGSQSAKRHRHIWVQFWFLPRIICVLSNSIAFNQRNPAELKRIPASHSYQLKQFVTNLWSKVFNVIHNLTQSFNQKIISQNFGMKGAKSTEI